MTTDLLVLEPTTSADELDLIVKLSCERCNCATKDLRKKPLSDDSKRAIGIAGYLILNDKKMTLDDAARVLGVPNYVVATEIRRWNKRVDICADVRDDIFEMRDGISRTPVSMPTPAPQIRAPMSRFAKQPNGPGECVDEAVGQVLIVRLRKAFKLPEHDLINDEERRQWARDCGIAILYRLILAKPSMPSVGRFFGVHHKTVLRALRNIHGAVVSPQSCPYYDEIEQLCMLYGTKPEMLKAPD